MLFYLSPADYHRFHAPISGHVEHLELLGCYAPACLLSIRVTAASVEVQATMTLPDDGGAGAGEM